MDLIQHPLYVVSSKIMRLSHMVMPGNIFLSTKIINSHDGY